MPDIPDLTDLYRFAHGFPHDVFTRLRAEAPVMWHEPTDALLDRVAHIDITGAVEWTRSNKHTGIRKLPVRLVPR